MAINKVWLCICLGWAVLGGTILCLLDHSVVGPVVWLVAAGLIGCVGPFFLERFVEFIPHWGEVWPADPFFIAPLAGLIHGTLLGPLVGMGIAFESAGEAWQGALIGALVAPPILSLVILVGFSLFPVRTSRPMPWVEEMSGLTPRHRLLIVLMCLVLPAIMFLALVQCVVVWIPRHRKRLRVYARLRDRGGVFGADLELDKFYGVRLEGLAIGDADVKLLRAFPELDHLALSGTQVTDTGLSYLQELRELKIVELARTAITDAGLANLAGLTGLAILDVSETRVTDAGLEFLQGLGNLKYLHLRGTQVTQTGVDRLLARLPALQVET